MHTAKRRATSVLVTLCLIVGLFSALGLALPVRAGADVPIQPAFGATFTFGDFVPTNQTSTVIFAGQEWYVIGYNDGINAPIGVNSGTPNTVTLLAKNPYFGQGAFGTISNEYTSSGLHLAMQTLYTNLSSTSPLEAALLQPRTLTASDGIAGTEVTDAKFWPLSEAEYRTLDASFGEIASGATNFWLRSPGSLATQALAVNHIGLISSESITDSSIYIRPACTISLAANNVFFTSQVGGKPSSAGLQAITPPVATSPVKLTIVNNALSCSVTFTAVSGNTLYFNYTTTGPCTRLSAYIMSSGGHTTHYGLLLDNPGAAGSASVTIPDGISASGGYRLIIIAEQVNGDTSSDYTSPVASAYISAPTGLSAGLGTILGTTSFMQYALSGTPTPTWYPCSDTETAVSASGTYKLRYNPVVNNVTINGTPFNCTPFSVSMPSVQPPSAIHFAFGSTVPDTDTTTIAFAGQEWYVIGYNNGVNISTGVNSGTPNTITLLAKNPAFGKSAFHGSSHEYDGSTLQGAMDNAFTSTVTNSQEAALVLPRTLTASDGIAGPDAPDAMFWPLSIAEYNTLHPSFSDYYSSFALFWLRSPASSAVQAQAVRGNGSIISQNVGDTDVYIRPACTIQLPSGFSLASELGGKPASIGLKPMERPTHSPLKLTVIHPSLACSAAVTAVSGSTITISYTTTGPCTRLAGYIADDSGLVHYYGNLKDNPGAAGTITFTVPSSVTGASFYIIAEQVNAGSVSDFSSTQTTLSPSAVTGLQGVAASSSSAHDGKITGTTAAMQYSLNGSNHWLPCSDTETTGLAPGEYLLRLNPVVNGVTITPSFLSTLVTVPASPSAATPTAAAPQQPTTPSPQTGDASHAPLWAALALLALGGSALLLRAFRRRQA